MINLSVKLLKLLLLCLLILTAQLATATNWPIQKKIDLSSGFGDFRANRFHTGIDLRTSGRTGTPITAPVSGYIQRIRTSYTGYGKGLYLKGDDGFIYVFGHLLDFYPEIDTFLKKTQRETKRYFQDITFGNKEFYVKKGDFLGYTGQTGAGAPHLHFEKRTSQNFPLNPLTNGFELEDKVKPQFTSLGFKMMDSISLFDNALRELNFTTLYDSASQSYYLDTLIYFNKPFGIFAGVYDQMRVGGMQQSVYKLTLKIDNIEFYKVEFEKLDFDYQRSVNLRYEYSYAVNDDKRVQRLYNALGNDFPGAQSKNKSQGMIGYNNNLPYGHHQAEIIAEDAFGNKRNLNFNFIYGPEEELYKLDSHIVVNKKDHKFFFTPSDVIEKIQIDSVFPYINRNKQWGKALGSMTEQLDNGQIVCTFDGGQVTTVTLKLFAFSKNAIIQDNLFNGVGKKGKLGVDLTYEIINDGILINLEVRARQSSDARIELFSNDTLIETLYPKHINMTQYRCFIPPLEKYEHIDRIGYTTSKDSLYPIRYSDSLNIHLVGHKDNQVISYAGINFEFQKENFYKPRFIEIKKRFYVKPANIRLKSQIVKIYPESFICKSNFTMSYTVQNRDPFFERTGFGWYDEKEEKWVWLDTERDGYNLNSESTGGGTFVILYDLVEPKISQLNIFNDRSYTNRNFRVRFMLEDDLSGVTDDRFFNVKIDKEWLIPEYDPESKLFIARPAQPLSLGKHHMGIEVVDQVGNKTEQYLNFIIKKDK